MYPHHPGGQAHPSHWAQQHPQNSPPPANGAYPPPPQQHQPLPPPPGDPRADMTSLQQQQPYRLPAPHQMYPGPPPPHDPYRQPPPQMYQQHQPAPRQRTAIACRYCRRRKIRCSGFEASEDGRCTNCVRFSQECIFTPVSAQTQAFVPAHTVWRGNGQAPPLYGAYGQPLPPAQTAPEGYGPPPPRAPGYPLPSPSGPYPPAVASPVYASHPGFDERGRDASGSRKRPLTEPHTPTLPPPNPATASHLPAHRASGPPEYTYPDPSALTPAAASPASSTTSFQSAPQPPAQPYYAPQPPRRSSPQSAYSYDPSRASSSPHTQGAPSTPGGSTYMLGGDATLRPPSNLPVRTDGRTPPPTSAAATTAGTRAGMRISDIVGGESTRSAADADMLNALNRRGM